MTQSSFYHSRQWKALSRAFLSSKMYICERCGGPASIAHHKIYLNAGNLSDPSVALNIDNLEALCQTCHNQEHFANGCATAPGLHFNEKGELVSNGL